MKHVTLAFLVLIFAACSSTPKFAGKEVQQDVVVSRIDNLSDRPKWLKESEMFRIEGGRVISTGLATIPADHRIEAAYRIAQNNARAAISHAIESRLSFTLQNAEEGTSIDSTQTRYIGAEASELVTNAVRPGQQYWERVMSTTDSGQAVTQYKVFATVIMDESEFKKAVLGAIRKGQKQGKLSADFQEKVSKHWDDFTRGPASAE